MDTTNQNEATVDGFLVRLNGKVWGIALGTLAALGLFVATNILVIKGGETVGQHLGLLGHYFPGYDVTFTKSAPSIFFQTPLMLFLTKQRVDTVIVTGCTTSGCVRASINDSFSYGFRTIVPEQCCGDQELQPHKDNLRDVGRRYADVLDVDEVIGYIDGLEPTAQAVPLRAANQ